jgi:hypothetical protein
VLCHRLVVHRMQVRHPRRLVVERVGLLLQ